MSLPKLEIVLTYWTKSAVWHGVVTDIPSIEAYRTTEEECIADVHAKLVLRGLANLTPDTYATMDPVDR
jgi:hypothetical protein